MGTNAEEIILRISGDNAGGMQALKEMADAVSAFGARIKGAFAVIVEPVRQVQAAFQSVGAVAKAAAGPSGMGALEAESSKLQGTVVKLTSQNTALTSAIAIAKQRMAESASQDGVKSSTTMALNERLRQLQEKLQGNQSALATTSIRLGETATRMADLQRASTSLPATWNAIKSALSEVGSRAQGVIGTFASLSQIGKTIAVGLGVTAVGGIIALVAAFGPLKSAIQSVASEALAGYASYERLGMALQSLAAKEIVAAGGATDVKAAMGQAAPIAKKLLDWVQKLGIESPFTSDDIAQSFRLAMAYGFTSTEAKRLTTVMVDFAAGSGATGDSMQRIALALGQVKARGHLAGGEILQLTEAGLNVRDALLKAGTVAGLTAANFQDMQEKGLIPADAALKGIIQTLETDFAGAAKAQAGTFSGLISSLQDIKAVGLREFFESTFKAIQPLLAKFTATLGSPAFLSAIKRLGAEVGKVFGNLIAPAQRALDFLSQYLTLQSQASQGIPAGATVYTHPASAAGAMPGANLGLLRGTIQAALGPDVLAMFDQVTGKINEIRTVIGLLASGDIAGATAKIGTWIGTIATALVNAWPTISAQLGKWGTQFWNWLTEPGGPISTAGTKIAGVVGAISGEITKNWPAISAELSKWATKFWTWITGPGGVVETALTKLDAVMVAISGWVNSDTTKTGIFNVGSSLGSNLVGGLESLASSADTHTRTIALIGALLTLINDTLKTQAEVIKAIGGGLALGLLDGLVSKIRTDGPAKVGQALLDLLGPTFMLGAFSTQGKENIKGVGASLIDGLKQGFADKSPEFYAELGTTADNSIGSMADLFGTHSPSTVFAALGGNLVQGLINGVKTNAANFINALSELATLALTAFGTGEGFAGIGGNLVQGLVNGLAGADLTIALTTLATTLGTNLTNLLTIITVQLQMWLTMNFMQLALLISMNLSQIVMNVLTKIAEIVTGIQAGIQTVADWLVAKWDEINVATTAAWEVIRAAIESAVNAIYTVVMSIVTLVGTTLGDAFAAFIKMLKETVAPYFAWFNTNVLQPFGTAIGDIARGVLFLIGIIEDAIAMMGKLSGKVNSSPVMGHSPSPFETSLIGIAAAARVATAELARMNVSALAFTPGLSVGIAGGMAGTLASNAGFSMLVQGGMNNVFPNVRDGRDAGGVRRELARTATQAYMRKRA